MSPSRLAAAVGILLGVVVVPSGCGGGAPAAPANASPGERVFDQTGCGSCHTLAAAGSTGTVGPKLNRRSLEAATVERWVRTGGGGMPRYQQQLTNSQLQQVATFVARASR